MRAKVSLSIAMAACLVLTLAACEKHGRYQIVAAHGSPAQEERVWVLDTESGKVSLCFETSAHIDCLSQSESPGQRAK